MTITVSSNNGTAPASALANMPGNNGDGTRQTSPVNVVASYGRLRDAMRAAGQGDLIPSSGWSCYRDRAAQQHMRNIGLTTIPVGQSIHGEWSFGGAVDFANLGGFGAARHNWLRSNGARFGWYQPGWAQAGGSLPEPWHWEYDQRTDPLFGTTPPDGGFLMALSDAQQDQLFNEVMNLRGWVWAGGPDVNAGAADPGSISARTIHMDQVLAGAQATPGNALGRIMNIDQQVAGADGFEASVAERVIAIEDATVTNPPPSQHSHGTSWRGLIAFVLAVCLGLAYLALVIIGAIEPGNLPEDTRDMLSTVGGALIGALAVYLGGRRGHSDD